MEESNKGRFEQGYFGLHTNLVHEKKWEYSNCGKGKKKKRKCEKKQKEKKELKRVAIY